MERVNRRELEQLKQYETKQAIKTKRVVRNKGHPMRTKGQSIKNVLQLYTHLTMKPQNT